MTALAALFYTAFFFGYRGGASTLSGGRPGALPAATTGELIIVIGLAVAAGLPFRVAISLSMDRAGPLSGYLRAIICDIIISVFPRRSL